MNAMKDSIFVNIPVLTLLALTLALVTLATLSTPMDSAAQVSKAELIIHTSGVEFIQ